MAAREPKAQAATTRDPEVPAVGSSTPGGAPPSTMFEATDTIATMQLTQFQLAWIRLRRHRMAMIGIGILSFMVIMAIVAPWVAPESPYDPNAADVFNAADKAPTFADGLRYIFGADYNGHSISSQTMWGARFSLLIGFVSAVAGIMIGVVVGSVSGYFGNWVDTILMRIVDVFLALPILPILLIAAAILGGGHLSVALMIEIFVIFGWAYPARLVRGQFLSLRQMEFSEAARAVGVSVPRIIFRHLLPNTLRPILVATTLAVASNIIFESAIDFLGIGLQYPDTSWGSVLAFAELDPGGIKSAWWVTVFPGLFLVATIVAINFIGDGLSDALDVRQK